MCITRNAKGRVALCAGPADAALRSLKSQANLPWAKELVSTVTPKLKKAGYDLEADLQEREVKRTVIFTMEEDSPVSAVVKMLGQLVHFMAQGEVETLPSDFIATTGDRPGMFAAVALAAASTPKELLSVCSVLSDALLALGDNLTSADSIVAAWQKAGITLPKTSQLRLPVLGCDGRGDLSHAGDLTQQLASLTLSAGSATSTSEMEESHKKVKSMIHTVVPFGCPESGHGLIQLPVDGVRDEATLNYMLPDVAEIRKEVVKRGYAIDVSLPLSFFWLFHDLALNGGLIYGTYLLLPYLSNMMQWLVVWPLYSLVVGTTLTGVWVIGHECGHRAFSGTGANSWINDVVGFVTHTPLLVPFWAWRYSHHKHHMYTNHLLDGETHVPNHRNGAKLDHSVWKVVGDDAFVIWNVIQHLVFGWPLYLFSNATGGRRTPQGEKINRRKALSHFAPSSQIFENNQRSMIMPGTVGCVAWLVFLGYLDFAYGLGTSLFWFWGAYTVVNGWLVLYTWLHHSDKDIPHFSDGQFSYMRGATSSCDRNYPSIINYVHHHIGSTHVLHHISFQLPHYRAEDATKVFRERYPHLYRYDTRPLMETLLDVSRTCHYVDDVQGVQRFKSLPELAASKKK